MQIRVHQNIIKTILLTYRINIIRCMEVLQLMWQQLSDVQENQTAHSQQIIGVRVMHHGRHLPILVPINVHPPAHRQSGQLVVLLVFRHVSGTKHRFVFEENAIVADGARQVIHASATRFEATYGRSEFAAVHADRG